MGGVLTRVQAWWDGESSDSNNAASEAVRLLYDDLVRIMQQPELLACELYSEGVVPEGALEEMNVLGLTSTQKRMKLLSFVRDQIAVDEATLDKFVEVLKKQPPMKDVAVKLERTYCELFN